MKKNPGRVKPRGTYLHLFLIIILALIIYSNTFNASWHFDDYPSILENYKIKDFSTCLRNILSNSRGICDLSFTVNYYINGSNVFGFHIINLAIHIVSAFMVYLLISFTLNIIDEKTANKNSLQFNNLPLIGSLIFVAHPIQTQAVTYIAQRYTSLASMFYLLALVLFIKAKMNLINRNVNFFSKSHFPFYLFSIICTILAMKTKEIAVTLPVIFFLYDSIFFKKTIKELKTALFYLLPFFILFLIPVISRIYIVNPGFTELGEVIDRSFKETLHITRKSYAITSINVILTYIRLLFFPVNQHIHYIYPISNSIFFNYTHLSILTHIGIIILAVKIFKKSKLISFGIFWFYITISVESGIVPIRDVIFEHRLYLPLVGFVIFIIGLLSLVKDRKSIFYIFLTVIISILSVVTYNRNFVWQNEFTLWSDCIAKSKNNPNAYFNLGNFYLDKRLYDMSIAEYKKALRINPDYALVHNNLGYAYYKKGLSDLAIKEYMKAITINPFCHEAHTNIGIMYYYQGKLGEASKKFEAALKIKPDYAEAHKNLGDVYFDNEKITNAINEYQIAIKLKSDFAEAHMDLGNAFFYQNRIEKAIKEYQNALKIKPNYTEVHYNLGMAYRDKKLINDAIEEFKLALKIKPDFIQARQAIESLSK